MVVDLFRWPPSATETNRLSWSSPSTNKPSGFGCQTFEQKFLSERRSTCFGGSAVIRQLAALLAIGKR